MGPPWLGHFWPQGHNSQCDATYQISWFKALWFNTRRFFHVSPYLSLCKACDPSGRAIFGPRGIILTKWVEDHQAMLHIKYHGSRPCGFRQEDFFMFLPI